MSADPAVTGRCGAHKRVRDLAYVLGFVTAAELGDRAGDRTVCEALPRMHYHEGAECLGPAQTWPTCRQGGCARRLVPFAVKATTVPGVSCEAKCQTAEGASCRCSCGGRRHGREVA